MKNAKPSKLNHELRVYRFKNGFKLINPNLAKKYSIDQAHFYNTGYNLEDIMDWSLSVYCLNKRYEAQMLNEQALVQCGIDSEQDALAKTIAHFAHATTARRAMHHSRIVMHSEKTCIFDEEVRCKNNQIVQSISIKAPWYEEDQVVGILGFSIDIQKQHLAQSLNLISQLGLLNGHNRTFNPDFQLDFMLLTEREKECLELTRKGKTAKQCAQLLGLSYRTIENYLHNIKSKLNVSSKSELIAKTMHYAKLVY